MTASPDSTPLPDGLDAVFQALALPATQQQRELLRHYLDLLQKWNATYNLTAVRDPSAMITQHLADCLAVIAPMQRQGVTGRVLDVGSGGGLPGAVIATLMPELEVVCVDTVGKKAAFLRQVAGALPLRNLRAIHARVEALQTAPYDLVTCRAFSSLADFTRLTRGHLRGTGVWMAMKGKQPDEEIAALPPNVTVFHVEQLTVPGLDADRCLVWMRPTVS